jgi:hypothetical protein
MYTVSYGWSEVFMCLVIATIKVWGPVPFGFILMSIDVVISLSIEQMHLAVRRRLRRLLPCRRTASVWGRKQRRSVICRPEWWTIRKISADARPWTDWMSIDVCSLTIINDMYCWLEFVQLPSVGMKTTWSIRKMKWNTNDELCNTTDISMLQIWQTM